MKTPIAVFKSNSYAEQVALIGIQKILSEYPVDEFFSVRDSADSAFSINLTLIGGWPEEPTQIPAFIVVALIRKVERAGLMANPYYNEVNGVSQFVQFFIGTGTYTFTLQAHSYDFLYKMQSYFNYILTSKDFFDFLVKNGISPTSNYLTWTNPSQRTYSTLKYHLMSCNMDFRVEFVNGYTDDSGDLINEVVSIGEKE